MDSYGFLVIRPRAFSHWFERDHNLPSYSLLPTSPPIFLALTHFPTFFISVFYVIGVTFRGRSLDIWRKGEPMLLHIEKEPAEVV